MPAAPIKHEKQLFEVAPLVWSGHSSRAAHRLKRHRYLLTEGRMAAVSVVQNLALRANRRCGLGAGGEALAIRTFGFRRA
jgi:hypothetical protein